MSDQLQWADYTDCCLLHFTVCSENGSRWGIDYRQHCTVPVENADQPLATQAGGGLESLGLNDRELRMA